jgi:hypothetical protein
LTAGMNHPVVVWIYGVGWRLEDMPVHIPVGGALNHAK